MLHESELFRDVLSTDYALREQLLYYTLLLKKRNKRKSSCVVPMRTLSGDIKRYRLAYHIEEIQPTKQKH